MPGSVANAAPSTVMPFGACKAFSESRELAVRGNEYPDGTLQRVRQVATSRRSFSQTRRLAGSDLVALRTFWLTVRHGAFYFYHSKEGAYDATGVATAGRYTVRFEGDWSQAMEIARGEVGLGLVEVA